MNVDDYLKKLYYDPKQGLISEQKLYKKIQAANIKISRKKLSEFLKKQQTVQQFYPQKIKTYFPIQQDSDKPFQRIQIDLMDMSNEPGQNKNY